MEIPDAFRCMAQCMHPDIDLDIDSEEELCRFLAGSVRNRGDRDIVIGFIDRLLASDMNDRKLGKIWCEAGAEWFIRRGMRAFLPRLRDEIRRRGENEERYAEKNTAATHWQAGKKEPGEIEQRILGTLEEILEEDLSGLINVVHNPSPDADLSAFCNAVRRLHERGFIRITLGPERGGSTARLAAFEEAELLDDLESWLALSEGGELWHFCKSRGRGLVPFVELTEEGEEWGLGYNNKRGEYWWCESRPVSRTGCVDIRFALIPKPVCDMFSRLRKNEERLSEARQKRIARRLAFAMNGEDLRTAHAFLAELLACDLDDNEFTRVCKRAGAQWRYCSYEERWLLERLCSAFAERLGEAESKG